MNEVVKVKTAASPARGRGLLVYPLLWHFCVMLLTGLGQRSARVHQTRWLLQQPSHVRLPQRMHHRV